MGRRYRLWVCHRTVNSAGNLPAGVQLRWQAVAERSRKSVARNARSRRRRGLLCGPACVERQVFGVLFVTTVSDRPPAREGEIRFFGSERYQRSREPTTGTGAAYLRVTGRWAVFIYHLLLLTTCVVSNAPPAVVPPLPWCWFLANLSVPAAESWHAVQQGCILPHWTISALTMASF